MQKGILSVYSCKFIVDENSRSIEFECLSPGPVLAHSGLRDIQDRFNPKNYKKTISIKFKTTFSSPLYERSRAKETLENTKEKECTTEQGQSVKKRKLRSDQTNMGLIWDFGKFGKSKSGHLYALLKKILMTEQQPWPRPRSDPDHDY